MSELSWLKRLASALVRDEHDANDLRSGDLVGRGRARADGRTSSQAMAEPSRIEPGQDAQSRVEATPCSRGRSRAIRGEVADT